MTEYKHRNKTTYGVENYVCPNCFYPLEKCTCKVFPPYYLLMIDKGMQHIIRVLNKKGYKTIGCCESHFGTDSSNINVIFNTSLDVEVPEGFVKIKNGNGYAYYYKKNIDFEDWEKEKKKHLEILKEWSENLPKRKP